MKRCALLSLFVVAACGTEGSSPPPGGGGADGGGGPGPGPGAADAAGIPTDEPATTAACDGATLYERPADPGARGPWPVGARTVTVGRLTAEVWYPAAWDSHEGATPVRYDLRDQLPPSQQDIIPDADNPWQVCDCFRDLPIDEQHGPYPVVLFVHGTASFRTQSMQHMTHWASRGFVVIAADHPGLKLADMLSLLCPDSSSGAQNLTGDADALLAAVAAADGELAFLAGRVDTDRIAVAGHSAGAGAIAGLTNRPGVRVAIPMSGGSTVQSSPALQSTLFVTGMADAVARYDSVKSGYNASPAPRRLVGIGHAGHLVVSDLCDLSNDAGQNILEIAQEYGVCGTGLAGGLFDCDDAYIDGPTGWAIVNYATAAVLETELHCVSGQDPFADIQTRFADVDEYLESL